MKILKIIYVGHTFCKDCITTWFERQKTCPQCRRDIAIRPIPAYTVELQGKKKKEKKENTLVLHFKKKR